MLLRRCDKGAAKPAAINPGQASLGALYIFEPPTKSKHCTTLAYPPHQASLRKTLTPPILYRLRAEAGKQAALSTQAKLGRSHGVSLNCTGLSFNAAGLEQQREPPILVLPDRLVSPLAGNSYKATRRR